MNISEYEMEANQKDKAVMTLPSSSAIQFLFFFLLRSGRGRKRKRVRVREGHYSTPPLPSFPGNERSPWRDVWDPLFHVMAI